MAGFRHVLLGLGVAAILAACQETHVSPPGDAPPLVNAAPSPSAALADDVIWTRDGLSGAFKNAGPDAPALLIVPGSGPTDRDGNNPMGVQAASYRLLAEGLSSAGISTLRVDKRGMFGSSAAGDPNAVTQNIYAQDYLNWAAQLREETGRDCVYLLGHSEGGQMVAAAAAQDNTGICGLILVAAPGRPVFDVLREQLAKNPANAPILDDALDAIDQLESGERVDVQTLHPALQGLFAPAVQGFLISSYGVDPATLVKNANVPTLVLQGDNDLQITMRDAERLAADQARLVVLRGMNHVLKLAPDDQAGNMATYANPDLPLADGVIPAIADFIKN
jgi:hypothetical protein